MSKLLIAFLIIVATRYDHTGPLRIGHGRTPANTCEQWVAVDDSPHVEISNWDKWQGKQVILVIDGQRTFWNVWDSGYFDKKCVEQKGGCAPILFDIPLKHWEWGSDTSVIIDAVHWPTPDRVGGKLCRK